MLVILYGLGDSDMLIRRADSTTNSVDGTKKMSMQAKKNIIVCQQK